MKQSFFINFTILTSPPLKPYNLLIGSTMGICVSGLAPTPVLNLYLLAPVNTIPALTFNLCLPVLRFVLQLKFVIVRGCT